jgi:hypothetical protein
MAGEQQKTLRVVVSRMRLALAWLLGTTLFVLGTVLADRWFWWQCSGLASSRYTEVWICANVLAVRIAVGVVAGVAAGLLTRRRGLPLGLLIGLAGIAAVSLAYRPMLAFNQPLAVLHGILYFVLPTTAAAVLASIFVRRKAS